MKSLNVLEAKLTDFVRQASGNYINEENAITKDLVGLRIYDAPLIGAASASDVLFEELKNLPPHGLGKAVIKRHPQLVIEREVNARDLRDVDYAWELNSSEKI